MPPKLKAKTPPSRVYPDEAWILLTIGSELPEMDIPGELLRVPCSWPKALSPSGTNLPKQKRTAKCQVDDMLKEMASPMRQSMQAYVDYLKIDTEDLAGCDDTQGAAFSMFISMFEVGWRRLDYKQQVPEVDLAFVDWPGGRDLLAARVHICVPFDKKTRRLAESVVDEFDYGRSLFSSAKSPGKSAQQRVAATPQKVGGGASCYTVEFGMAIISEIIACSDGNGRYAKIGVLSRNRLYDACESFFAVSRNSLKGLMRAHRVVSEHKIDVKVIARKFASLSTFVSNEKENSKAYQTLKAAFGKCQLSKNPKGQTPRSKKDDDAAFATGLEQLIRYVEQNGKPASTKASIKLGSNSSLSSSSSKNSNKKRKMNEILQGDEDADDMSDE